jgi:ATP-binding cassette subfamily C exporter for protease/lipase
MIAATVLMGRTVQPMQTMVGAWRMSMGAWDSFKRLDALLLDHPEIERQPLPQALRGAVEVQGLAATAPNRALPILTDINARIEPGDTVVILGPSGSGKSTLARCMIGIWPQTQGQVRLDGMDVTGLDRDDLGVHLGYMPQDVELFEGTVADNIARFGEVDAQAVIAAARMAGVHDMILRLPQGYDTPMSQGASNLSGGQRQRLALARAVLQNPRMLILDEATSALDARTERQVCNNLFEAFRGRTVFFITHRLSTVRPADMIVLMDKGAVMEVGSHDQLMEKRGWYYALFRSQLQEGLS